MLPLNCQNRKKKLTFSQIICNKIVSFPKSTDLKKIE